MFLLAGIVNVIGGLVYIFFGKCDLQPWAREVQVRDETGENKERLLQKEEETFILGGAS